MEELNSAIRDFGRYVVDQLRPKTNFFASKIFLVIMFIAVILMLVLFGPLVFDMVTGLASGASNSVGAAAGSATVTPR